MSSNKRSNPLYQPKLLCSALLICHYLVMAYGLAQDTKPEQEDGLSY